MKNKDSGSAITPIAIAALVAWILFYAFEIFIPHVDDSKSYEQKCNDLGGFVANFQNSEKMCIKKDIILIEVK